MLNGKYSDYFQDKIVVFPNIMFMFHSIFPLTFKKLYKMQLIALITSIYQLSYWNRASIYVHTQYTDLGRPT